MRKRSACVLAVAVLAVGACGGDGDDEGGGGGGGAARTSEGPKPTIADVPGDRESLGAQVVLRSGCIGCHRLGSVGNEGPGRALTRIGAQRSARQIERALLNPPSPMPAYESLPRDERAALVKYLASLR